MSVVVRVASLGKVRSLKSKCYFFDTYFFESPIAG